MAAIVKVADRAKLKPRRDPYFAKLSHGAYLGWRKMAPGSEGTWLARWRDPDTGKQHQQPLGTLDHLPPSERHDEASRQARAWFERLGMGGRPDSTTVAEACTRYVEHLRRESGEAAAADAKARFTRHIDGTRLAKIELDKLRPALLKDWRRALQDKPTKSGGRRTDASLNRDMSALRAALNQALGDQLVSTDAAWVRELKPIKDADRRRELYLDRAQRQALIDAAAPDIAMFIKVIPTQNGPIWD